MAAFVPSRLFTLLYISANGVFEMASKSKRWMYVI
jgi:hypothetical protein